MNAIFIWVFLPALFSIFLLFLRNKAILVAVLGTIFTILLAILAWGMPVEETIRIGPWFVTFSDTYAILGRQFTLAVLDRPALLILYMGVALWYGAVPVAKPGRLFVPLSLGMVSLLTATIAIDPFLYAAIFIELAVLLSIPFLVRDNYPPGKGVLRYLTYYTLGMPFILFAGWMFSGLEVAPAELYFVLLAVITMAIGFSLLLAIIPFHTWIPMLAMEAHPYTAAFVFLLLPGAVFFFVVSFLENYIWLNQIQVLPVAIQWIGMFVIITAGILAAFENHLARLMGFAVILSLGFSILTLSLAIQQEFEIYYTLLYLNIIPLGLCLAIMALALVSLQRIAPGLSFSEVAGIGRKTPLVMISIVLAIFSLAGMPLLASFPGRLLIFEGLSQLSPNLGLFALLGSVGLVFAGIRSLKVFLFGPEQIAWTMTESTGVRIFLGMGILLIFILGTFPQFVQTIFLNFSPIISP
jgi:NADH-quinone oxidoreductase subunit N